MTKARALLLGGALLLAGCGGDGGGAGVCANPVEAETVVLSDFAFRPDCLQAEEGAQISLRNTGEAPHTFTIEGTTVDFNLPAGTSTGSVRERAVDEASTTSCTPAPTRRDSPGAPAGAPST